MGGWGQDPQGSRKMKKLKRLKVSSLWQARGQVKHGGGKELEFLDFYVVIEEDLTGKDD